MMIVVQGMESHVKDKMSGDHWELCQINIGKQPFLRFISIRTELGKSSLKFKPGIRALSQNHRYE
jgi:hypothetical protein